MANIFLFSHILIFCVLYILYNIYIIYIYIYIYIYICNHENNVLSRLSPQWFYGDSCTWAHDVRLQIAGTNELESAQQAKRGT